MTKLLSFAASSAAARGSRGRRHHRGRRSGRDDRRRHDLRCRGRPSRLPADPIDPPTLAMTFSVNDCPLAGREGNKVTWRMIARAALSRGRGQCRDPGAREQREGFVRGRRPRRVAARRPDRDDAPRGLRAVDLAPAGAVPHRSGDRPAARADRGGHRRRRRGLLRDRRRADEPAQGRDAGHAARRAAASCGCRFSRRPAA